MREQYWKMYTDIVHRSFYYKHFQGLFTLINWLISSFLTITSLSCIAAWSVWGEHPLLWSLLICAAQIVQALFPKLAYNDLLISTKFMICSLDKLLLSIEHDWLRAEFIDDFSDKEYWESLLKYQSQYSELVSQFFSGYFLPEIGFLSKKSEIDTKNYFARKFTNN